MMILSALSMKQLGFALSFPEPSDDLNDLNFFNQKKKKKKPKKVFENDLEEGVKVSHCETTTHVSS